MSPYLGMYLRTIKGIKEIACISVRLEFVKSSVTKTHATEDPKDAYVMSCGVTNNDDVHTALYMPAMGSDVAAQ